FFDSKNSLWVTDGTGTGTVRLSITTQMDDLSSVPGTFAAGLNGRLIFRGSDGELWVSDGTPAGTTRVKDINPSGSSSPGWFTVIGDTAYFLANDKTHGRELWRTDGTTQGT